MKPRRIPQGTPASPRGHKPLAKIVNRTRLDNLLTNLTFENVEKFEIYR